MPIIKLKTTAFDDIHSTAQQDKNKKINVSDETFECDQSFPSFSKINFLPWGIL